MMKRLLFVALGVLAYVMAFSNWSWAGELTGQQIISTGIYQCDSAVHRMNWPNPTRSTLYIKQAQIWFGLSMGGKADYAGTLVRLSDSSIILGTGWDHYADPTTLHQYTVKFSPDYFTLAPGDILQFQYSCTPATEGIEAEQAVTIWYTVDAP